MVSSHDYVLICVGVVPFVAGFIVLWYDIQIPNELRGFLFYAQVNYKLKFLLFIIQSKIIGLVYRPYSIVNVRGTIDVSNYIYYIIII